MVRSRGSCDTPPPAEPPGSRLLGQSSPEQQVQGDRGTEQEVRGTEREVQGLEQEVLRGTTNRRSSLLGGLSIVTDFLRKSLFGPSETDLGKQ